MDSYKLRPLREVSSEIWGRLEGQGLVNGLFRDRDLGRGLHAFEDAAERGVDGQ